MMPDIVFFGTHEFAGTILQALISAGYPVLLVITQPDHPVGRHQVLTESPVKRLAREHTIPIAEPERLKNWEPTSKQPTLAIVCQYGKIIPQRILDWPKTGAINVHTSLLPKYRGASPIQTAILHGETETGITIMLMDEQMDHGGILAQKKVAIETHDTSLTLAHRLAPIAATLLLETIPGYLAKKITPQTQDESQVTLCSLITKEDGKITWQDSASNIYNAFRAYTPWPGVWTTLQGKRLKLLDVAPSTDHTLAPGIISCNHRQIFIGCGNGALRVNSLQLEGKPAMDSAQFGNGYQQIYHLATLGN